MKSIEIGSRIVVEADEFLGTPSSGATVLEVHPTYLIAVADDEPGEEFMVTPNYPFKVIFPGP